MTSERDNEEIAGEGGGPARRDRGGGMTRVRVGDKRGADGGNDEQSEPAGGVRALVGEECGGGGEQDGHGADHQRRVRDGGAVERPENWMRNWSGIPRKAQRRRVPHSRAIEAGFVGEEQWKGRRAWRRGSGRAP